MRNHGDEQIHYVGSRDEERPIAADLLQLAVKNALKLKEQNPGMDIYVLYRT
jgi:hypothetical protein